MKTTTSLVLPKQSEAKSTLKAWLNRDNTLFTAIMEESVSNANVLRISHAVTAFVCLISSQLAGPIAMLISLAWFGIALYLCKKGGLK